VFELGVLDTCVGNWTAVPMTLVWANSVQNWLSCSCRTSGLQCLLCVELGLLFEDRRALSPSASDVRLGCPISLERVYGSRSYSLYLVRFGWVLAELFGLDFGFSWIEMS
jgi:hypothetical protein